VKWQHTLVTHSNTQEHTGKACPHTAGPTHTVRVPEVVTLGTNVCEPAPAPRVSSDPLASGIFLWRSGISLWKWTLCLNKRSTKNMPPHRISYPAGASLDESFLDVGVGRGGAYPDLCILFLPLTHAVCQEVDLHCHTAHAFLDLPAVEGI